MIGNQFLEAIFLLFENLSKSLRNSRKLLETPGDFCMILSKYKMWLYSHIWTEKIISPTTNFFLSQNTIWKTILQKIKLWDGPEPKHIPKCISSTRFLETILQSPRFAWSFRETPGNSWRNQRILLKKPKCCYYSTRSIIPAVHLFLRMYDIFQMHLQGLRKYTGWFARPYLDLF